MLRYLPALLLAACTEREAPLPTIEGLTPIEDVSEEEGVVEVHLTASTSTKSWVDGGQTGVWAYNDEVPGPLIQARVGETLRVVFTNDLPDETTIHWHGLRVPDEMDGVPAVQAPVQPGETFTYEFVLPDAGTFWYHPHIRSHEQIERGLQGMLVVHEAEPPPYDAERAFVLDDVALRDDGRIMRFALSGMDGVHGRHGNVLLVDGSADPLVANVISGTVERWRIVNTANARTMWIDVKDADWRVVAIDGTLLAEPIPGDRRVQLPVGRRFDLEVVVGDVAPSLAIELPGQGQQWDTYPVFEPALVDEGRDAAEFLPWSAPTLPDRLPIEQELEIVLGVEGGPVWTINGQPYGEGDDIPVRAGVPTRITVEETTGFEHPFHLHGQFFEVMNRTDGEMWPGQLDTLLMHPGTTAELYTTFDNPGLWMAHCHILEHAELGMMTAFMVE